MPKAPNDNTKARKSCSPISKPINYMDIYAQMAKLDRLKPKSAEYQYWADEHRSRIMKAFIPAGARKRVYGRPITMVRGTTLGIPDGKTFGVIEPRKVEGIEEATRNSLEMQERAIMAWDGPDDFKAERLRRAKQGVENTLANEIWSNHPESGDPSIRYSTVVDAEGKPWLTLRWWSALDEAIPAYYFDIVDRASDTVLKPPKDLQMLNVWAHHIDVLPTIERVHADARAQDVIENGKVIRVPMAIPEEREERYRAAAGSIVVVLCDYRVVGHVQVPVVVI